MDRPPFASLLLQLRQAAGLTQDELAARARVGVRTVRDLEAGRATRPQRSTVDLLAEALGLVGPARARFEAAARGRRLPMVSLPRVEPLIARDDDLAGVAALIEVADLVTIVGLTGVGKAVLAIHVASDVADRFPGGVGAVPVTEASTEAEILASAATALGAPHVEELALRRAATADPALLVVTNADRSLAAATAAITWLRRSGLRIVATSRQPLGLPAEHEWLLAPLDVPPPDVTGPAVFDYPATRLFLERLRRVRAQPVTEADATVLAALVRRLGGLPFALELAAARGRVLGLPELLARAGQPAAGPAPTRRERDPDAPASDQLAQTVRSAVLASWDLLTPVEQACLCWLSVFQWRWSMDLAEDLLAACPEARGHDVVAVVDRLVGLGLVRARTDTPLLRLHVIDAVRWVALEQAQARGVLTAARDQHATVIARVCAGASAGGDEDGRASGVSAGRTAGFGGARTAEPGSAVASQLVADIRAAVDHLGVGRQAPRQRHQASRDGMGEVRRGLVEWLSDRGLAP